MFPPELLEVIWFSPCNWPNCRSRGAVTVVATTVGAGPRIKRQNLNRWNSRPAAAPTPVAAYN